MPILGIDVEAWCHLLSRFNEGSKKFSGHPMAKTQNWCSGQLSESNLWWKQISEQVVVIESIPHLLSLVSKKCDFDEITKGIQSDQIGVHIWIIMSRYIYILSGWCIIFHQPESNWNLQPFGDDSPCNYRYLGNMFRHVTMKRIRVRFYPCMHKFTINSLEFVLPQWPEEQTAFQWGPNQAPQQQDREAW